jgi:hypothetical protein
VVQIAEIKVKEEGDSTSRENSQVPAMTFHHEEFSQSFGSQGPEEEARVDKLQGGDLAGSIRRLRELAEVMGRCDGGTSVGTEKCEVKCGREFEGSSVLSDMMIAFVLWGMVNLRQLTVETGRVSL